MCEQGQIQASTSVSIGNRTLNVESGSAENDIVFSLHTTKYLNTILEDLIEIAHQSTHVFNKIPDIEHFMLPQLHSWH